MSDSDLLAQIHAIAPRTKSARLRSLMPAIEAKLAAGATAQDVVAALEQGGLSLTVATFRNYLARSRRRNISAQGSTTTGAASTTGVHGGAAPNTTAPCNQPAPRSVRDLHEAMYPRPDAQASAMAQYERIGIALSRQKLREGQC